MSEIGIILLILALPVFVLVVTQVIKHKKKQRLTASTCGTKAYPGGTLKTHAWHIGPIIEGVNKSPGMPPHPTPAVGGGWYVDIPVGIDLPLRTGSKLGYITFKHGPLDKYDTIIIRGRVDMEPGTEIRAVPEGNQFERYIARITPYFQQEDDNWSAEGKYETYRWYAISQGRYLDQAGEFELIVSLKRDWGALMVSNWKTNPIGFETAKKNCCCLGVVFGGNDNGIGHGIRATAPARLTITEFTVK